MRKKTYSKIKLKPDTEHTLHCTSRNFASAHTSPRFSRDKPRTITHSIVVAIITIIRSSSGEVQHVLFKRRQQLAQDYCRRKDADARTGFALGHRSRSIFLYHLNLVNTIRQVRVLSITFCKFGSCGEDRFARFSEFGRSESTPVAFFILS